ncbi:MAG: proton-conducting transporter membrane subunit [Pseudomonadota bacterium]
MLLAAPILLPLATAVICFLMRRNPLHRLVSQLSAGGLILVGVLILLTVKAAGPQAAQMGGWAAPYGITLAADTLSAVMIIITGGALLAAMTFATVEIGLETERLGFHALSHAMAGGVSGAFMTGDLFNLYVWFEVMLISSFGLLVIGGGRAQIDGAVKYVALNLVGTMAFLGGVGLLYGTVGTLNMADLGIKLQGRMSETAVLGAAGMLMFAFAAKAALFPVFFWLPASYHTPAVATSALFSALLTKVGVYSLLRVFTLVFTPGDPVIEGALFAAAGLTIALGALGAAAQQDLRRVFSFHIISQIGVMTLGLAIATPLALAGAIFYFLHHIPAMMNMFLLGGIIRRETGSETLSGIGGLYRAGPWLAVVFLIPMLSLIGVPPLSGFWAKFFMVRAGVEDGQYILAGLILAASVLTFFYLGRMFVAAFWQPHPGEATGGAVPLATYPPRALVIPVLALGAVTLTISLYAGSFYALSAEAASALLDPLSYLRAVGPDRIATGGGG